MHALRRGAAIADEHSAALSVIALVEHDESGGCCAGQGVSRSAWNQTMTEVAEGDLATARSVLKGHIPQPGFGIVFGRGDEALAATVAERECDLVVVATGRLLRRRRTRRLRRIVPADVLEVSSA